MSQRGEPLHRIADANTTERTSMESKLKYTIGIDLGTTNSVLAYCEQCEPGDQGNNPPEIRLLKIPQLVAPNTIEYQPSLASFSYLANEAESVGGAFDLPWSENRSFATGELARARGAEAPDRTVEHPRVGFVITKSIDALRSCRGTPLPKSPRSRPLQLHSNISNIWLTLGTTNFQIHPSLNNKSC